MGDSKKRSYNKGKNNYYAQSQKKKKVLSLEPGMQGFFCTCNFQEKNCVREAYNILNEYADKLYGPEEGIPDKGPQGDSNEIQENDEPNEEPDISDELSKQISDIKTGGKKFNRFQSVFTSVQNCVFIKTNNVEDPVKLGSFIIEDIASTKQQKTRFLLRLVPIEATCSVKMEDIISTAGKLFDKHFLGEPTTFSIVFNRRYNNCIVREAVIKELAELVVSKNCEHKADLTKAKLAVIVEIIKGICLLSVVPNYFQYKKYNLFEICAPPEDKNKTEEKKEVSDTPQEIKDGE